MTAVPPGVASRADCPKRMAFGPCGGVRGDGSCEMAAMPCVFDDVVGWSGVAERPVPVVAPFVLTDFSARAFDRTSMAEVAVIVGPVSDAVLVGEHQNRPDYPPTMLAAMLLDLGLRAWVTLACRDRNRVVLEQELRGLRDVGVETLLCVTGDGRAPDVRPDVRQVFDLDSMRLASLARSQGLVAAVAETPSAPPRRARPRRLVEKQRAGASIAVLNHVRDPEDVAAFLSEATVGGLTMPVIAAVAVFTDEPSAAALSGLPGLEIAPDVVAGVLADPDPVAAGIDAAVAEARALLAVPGVAGVNLSGSGSVRGVEAGAEIKAEVARRLRAEAT